MARRSSSWIVEGNYRALDSIFDIYMRAIQGPSDDPHINFFLETYRMDTSTISRSIHDDPIVVTAGFRTGSWGSWACSGTGIISAGHDRRGHEFTGQYHPDAGFRIIAGCRCFTIEQARTHWSEGDGYVKRRIRHIPLLNVWRRVHGRRRILRDLVDINRAIDALEAEARKLGWV